MRKKILCLIATISMLFSGCSFGGLSVDTLLKAPKLSEEQTNIYNALIDGVGSNITLRYPKSGDYRSAIIITNIDSEGGDEAIVFYEVSTTNTSDKASGGVRINILDKRGDEWVSVYDHAAFGTGIDEVVIGRFGNDKQLKILVGYNVLNSDEKTLQVYTYVEDRDKKLESIFSDNYTSLEIFDLDKDGNNELITITNNQTATTTNSALLESPEARIYKSIDGKIILLDKVLLKEGKNLSVSTVIGYINDPLDEKKVVDAIFVDSVKTNGIYTTEILRYNDNVFENLMLSSDSLFKSTVRQVGYESADIDRDEIIEIPVTKPFIGYEDMPMDSQMFMTDWCVYNGEDELLKKYSSYFSPKYGYNFIIPGRWLAKDSVTVKWDTSTDEIVFYKYKGKLTDDMVELMRILVTTRVNTPEKLSEGYQVFGSRGQIDYLIKIPKARGEELILTVSEVRQSFNILGN